MPYRVYKKKVQKWRNMRWYDFHTDWKITLKAMGMSLLPKYICKTEFRTR
jgi:hypothetical protein